MESIFIDAYISNFSQKLLTMLGKFILQDNYLHYVVHEL